MSECTLQSLDDESQLLGRACAATRLRLDERGRDAYKRAFMAYDGPRQFPDYYSRKWLSLRLSALKRGMVVDSSVTPSFLQRVTNGRCPVTLDTLDVQGRSSQTPSVDRLVNEVTYLAGNICVLSMRANRAKGALNFEEVLALAQKGEAQRSLSAVEWMRLASLMYRA